MAKFFMYKDNKRKWMFSGYVATCPLTGKKTVTTRIGFDTKAEASDDLDRLKATILPRKKEDEKHLTFIAGPNFNRSWTLASHLITIYIMLSLDC